MLAARATSTMTERAAARKEREERLKLEQEKEEAERKKKEEERKEARRLRDLEQKRIDDEAAAAEKEQKIKQYREKIEKTKFDAAVVEEKLVNVQLTEETPEQRRKREREERAKKLQDDIAAEEAALAAKMAERKKQREERAAAEKAEDDARLAEIAARRAAREGTDSATTTAAPKPGTVNSKIDEREKAAIVVKDSETGTTQVNLRSVLHGQTKKSELAAPVAARADAEHFDPTAGDKVVNKHNAKDDDAAGVDTSAPSTTFTALKKTAKGPAKRTVKTVDAAEAKNGLLSLLK